MIIKKSGNIFTTQCQTIVNTINCVGVMGAGIAYEFRLRDPKMFERYKELCSTKTIDIGKLWIYNTEDTNTAFNKILNFPTKYNWKYPSKEEYLHQGLQKFLDTYEEKGIISIAFPLLGADRGGLDKNRSIEIMEGYLGKCNIDVEIWEFDPYAKDDLYEDFKSIFNEIDDETIKVESKIRIDLVKKVRASIESTNINSLSGLLRVKGIGDKTLENLFKYINSYKQSHVNLFNYEM